MAKHRLIITVGFQFPGDGVEYEPITSHRSLQDADIIVFRPALGYSRDAMEENFDSFQHWQSELRMALDAKKLIIAFLPKPSTVILLNNHRPFETRLYEMLPVFFHEVTQGHGNAILLTSKGKLLKNYWQVFAEYSSFEAYIDGDFFTPLFTTKDGTKTVGACVETLFMLPNLQPGNANFVPYVYRAEDSWTEEERVFGTKLVNALLKIDDSLHGNSNATPPPEWSNSSEYRSRKEFEIENQIQEVNSSIVELQNKTRNLEADLSEIASLRRLLFETGRPLEEAIIDALRLLGFKADNYQDNESEFDAVFTSSEGRFIGESEGKENRSIDIEKFSQLERVLNEDFARDEINEHAKGVLFGNAYRLTMPNQRKAFFTEKCISGAKRLGVALVQTPDLFVVAQYLKETNDPEFARQCRIALKQTEGAIVKFPNIPQSANK